MSGWIEIGSIGVDAGLCWIGDPCYTQTDAPNDQAKWTIADNWDQFVDKLLYGPDSRFHRDGFRSFGFDKDRNGDGMGVVVSTGYGDGRYPVYIRKDSDGHIAEAKVVFIDFTEREMHRFDDDDEND